MKTRRDSSDTATPADLSPEARALLERISRSKVMIQAHRQGIRINEKRIAEAQAELQRIEGRS